METKPFTPNLNQTVEKTDGAREEKLAKASVAGAATIITGGVAASAFTNENDEDTIVEPVVEVVANQEANENNQEQITAVEPIAEINPIDVPLSDPVYAQSDVPVAEPISSDDHLALNDEDINEIAEMVLSIDEIDPADINLADVQAFDEIGILYTDNGDQIMLDGMPEDIFMIDVDDDLAMVDIDPSYEDSVEDILDEEYFAEDEPEPSVDTEIVDPDFPII